jgi:hypothetical protein
VTDFLDKKRREISDRIKQLDVQLEGLEPLIKEQERLKAAKSVLDGLNALTPSRAAARQRGPGRLRKSKTSSTVASPTSTLATKAKGRKRRKRRTGRLKGTGVRAAQTLELIQEQPGITTPELAARMGMQQNYLYRVLPGLQQEGKINKEGRGWHTRRRRRPQLETPR